MSLPSLGRLSPIACVLASVLACGQSPHRPQGADPAHPSSDDAIAHADGASDSDAAATSDVGLDGDFGDALNDTGVPKPDADAEPAPPDYIACDAGDEAWVMRTLPILLGRRPEGIEEVRALARLAYRTSRRDVALGLMQQPAFIDRWQGWLMDELRVNRVGSKKHDACYGAPLQGVHDGSLATYLRSNPPAGPGPGRLFNMTDVVRSALVLDDLSPVWRAHLFAMMSKPLTGANVDEIAMDITRRQDFGEIFEATYLHRNVVCAGCHNSQWGTTDHPGPELDRHWPLPGRPEAALYGADHGISEMTFYSMFRHLGVVGGPSRPWNMDEACGEFVAELDVDPDPAAIEAFFAKPRGDRANIWQVERMLFQGFHKLRGLGRVSVGPNGELDGAQAFAYLVSQRIANRVWREVMGSSLTLVHYIPRNEGQRDLLLRLTERLMASSWSLRELLAEILTDPLYNDPAPVEGCGLGDAYSMPAIFNPWTLLDPEEQRGNGPGDVLHRHDARLLLTTISAALEWPDPSPFPEDGEEAFQRAVGVFMKDAEPGFDGVDFQGLISFESRFGACANPTEEPDWLDRICDVAETSDEATTVADLASAIKDRLWAQPDLDASEGDLIAALFDVAHVDVALSQAEQWRERSRAFCGALLQSPQFLLTGLAPAVQTTTPSLALPQTDFQSYCERWSSSIAAAKWTLTCTQDDVTATPFVVPLGGP